MTSRRNEHWQQALMECEGVDYVQLHSSTHGTVKTNDGRSFDFWPSTGNWRDRSKPTSETTDGFMQVNATCNGLEQLINAIKGVKPEVKAEAHKSDLRVKLLNAQLGSVLRELAFLRAELQELRSELDS